MLDYTANDAWLQACKDAYFECALWSSTTVVHEGDDPVRLDTLGEPVHPHFDDGFYDDLEDFLADPEVAYLIGLTQQNAQQVGDDFWLTREGHGAGFWDRGNGPQGDRLAELTKAYGPGPSFWIHGGYIVHDEMSAALFVTTEEVSEP